VRIEFFLFDKIETELHNTKHCLVYFLLTKPDLVAYTGQVAYCSLWSDWD